MIITVLTVGTMIIMVLTMATMFIIRQIPMGYKMNHITQCPREGANQVPCTGEHLTRQRRGAP